MTTILRTLLLAIPGALTLILGACESSRHAKHSVGTPPVAWGVARGKLNGSKDPKDGLHAIGARLIWKKGTLPGSKRDVYWTTINGTNPDGKLQPLTLIAGALGDRGVQPPLKTGEAFTPGVCVKHTPGSDAMHPETVQLENGFLCVTVGPASAIRQEDTAPPVQPIAPWKLIIRTHAIPAGAYSTDYVLLGIDLTGGKGRQYVFRPNQDSFKVEGSCSGSAMRDSTGAGMVAVHPYDQPPKSPPYPAYPWHLTDTSYVVDDVVGTTGVVTDSPYPLPQEETDFLKNVCAFLKDARTYIANPANGVINPWNCSK